ncbi:MAG: hypothetical protein M1338_04215 [Patescibacteria group bacterium]|nr:hypothetical protein [Patescibacteria group bacterium]
MKSKVFLYILYAIVIIALAYAIYATKGFGLWKSNTDNFKTGSWQAVFLTNGQVYFGHLGSLSGQFVDMNEIYYLQVQKSIQPKDSSADQGKLTLVKLGNELHGPADKMTINRDQILFVEDMKEEGKVVQAIKRYIEKGPDQTESTPSPSATK